MEGATSAGTESHPLQANAIRGGAACPPEEKEVGIFCLPLFSFLAFCPSLQTCRAMIVPIQLPIRTDVLLRMRSGIMPDRGKEWALRLRKWRCEIETKCWESPGKHPEFEKVVA